MLFVYFLGGPAAILRACDDDTPPEECDESDFGEWDDMASDIPSDLPIDIDDGTAPESPATTLNDTGTSPTSPAGGTEPVIEPDTEPAPSPDTTPAPGEPVEPPVTTPEPQPETPPVEPVPESSLPDPSTETPPDNTPPETSVADPEPDAGTTETPPDNPAAPVADPEPDTSGEPPADDPSWSSDSGNSELSMLPVTKFEASSYTRLDEFGAWDGVNKFRVHDGNARRAVHELRLRGTVSQLGLNWSRYSNTVERAGRRTFGSAGHWRHSWQYDLMPLAPDKGDTRPRLALVYPDGTQRSFTRTGPGTYASTVGFPEQAKVTSGRVDIETGNGSVLRFAHQRRADGKFRYNLVSLADPHGQITQLDYDAQGFLTKVTELGSGRSLALSYKQLRYSAAERSILAKTKAPYPAAGQWIELPVDPKFSRTDFRYVRVRLHPSAQPARIAEIQFFAPGSDTPLVGTVVGDLSGGGQAFDGNASTAAVGDAQNLRYIGLDLGAAGAKVARVRILVGAGAPFAECAVEGLAVAPASTRVLTAVQSDDGRAVRYDYGTIRHALAGVQDIGLVRTRYGDGSTASYKYGYAHPAGYRPSMVEARDPRYNGTAKHIRYGFYPLRVEGTIGEIHRERHPTTGKILATRESDLAKDPLKRVVTYGDDRQVVYTMTAKGERTVALRKDELGRISRTEFTGKNMVPTSHIRHNGDRTDYRRDERGRTIAVTQTPKGAPVRQHVLQRDARGHATAQTDRFGRTQRLTRDSQGRVARVDHADGKFETRTYDSHGRPLTHRGRDGATRTFAYNSRGLPATVTDATGKTTRYAYNRHDQLVRTIDAAGRITRLVRDEHGRVVQRINSDGTSRRFAYDALGRHTATTDELGRTTTKEHDHLGRVTKVTDALGNITSYDYAELPNGCGACSISRRPTHIRLPSGQQIAQLFDAGGRLIARTVAQGSADSATTTYTYDDQDRLSSVADPKGRVTRLAYDAEGKLTRRTDSAGRATTFAYDAFDNVTRITGPDGRSRALAYDTNGRLARETDAAGRVTRYGYTAAGDLAVLIDAKGNRHRFTYDDQRRKTAMIYPDGSREKWSYDATGRLATYTTRAGQVKTHTYDGRGRLAKVAWSPAGAAPTVTYEYDSANQVKAIDNGVARLTYTYDRLGRMLTETTKLAATLANVAPQTLTYGYTAWGQRASLTYPDGSVVRYTYDGQGRLGTVSRNGTQPLATYGYDVDGRLGSVTRENGVSTRYSYDSLGHLLGIVHAKGASVLASSVYTLDSAGRRTSHTREDGLTEHYRYDETGQVTGVDYGVGPGANARPTRSVDYDYDALGNFQRVKETAGRDTTTTDYDANRLNQYTRIREMGARAPETLTYDRNGNLTGRNGRGSAADSRYRYNARNQLVVAETADVRMESYYDPRGRCVGRRESSARADGGWTLSTANSRTLLYDGWSLVSERRLDGTAVASYIHGGRIDEILAMVTPAATYYPLHDGLGSAVALVNGSGVVSERYRYDIFGTPRIMTADYRIAPPSPAVFRFLFTGREWLANARLLDFRHRIHTPQLGRFLQTDPIRFAAADSNIYRYAGNNSACYNDPHGLQATTIAATGGATGAALLSTAGATTLVVAGTVALVGVAGAIAYTAGTAIDNSFNISTTAAGFFSPPPTADDYTSSMANKPDIKVINDIQTKHGLTDEERNQLHDEMESLKKSPKDNLPWKVIDDLARRIKQCRTQ